MSKDDFKTVEIVEQYDLYRNVIFFNQTIYQSKTRKANGEGYYYTLKTVLPLVIYDYLGLVDDILYLVESDNHILLQASIESADDSVFYKRKLNNKSHNFTVPKQLFHEFKYSDFIATFIFIPSHSMVCVRFH